MINTHATVVEADYGSWPRVRVSVRDPRNPWLLVLFFAHLGKAPAFLGFEVLADQAPTTEIGDEASLDPRAFGRLARTLSMYVDYARAEVEWKYGDRTHALEALREAGKSRRGLSDKFYEEIGRKYDALIREGKSHPIKSIALSHHVDKSRASRWVKEARRMGYVATDAD